MYDAEARVVRDWLGANSDEIAKIGGSDPALLREQRDKVAWDVRTFVREGVKCPGKQGIAVAFQAYENLVAAKGLETFRIELDDPAYKDKLHTVACSLLLAAKVESPELPTFSLQTPTVLLDFRQRDSSRRPDYCKDPRKVLAKIQSHVVGVSGCSARLDAAAILTWSCDVLKDGDCFDDYSATVWAEHYESSRTDYRILGLAWVKRRCRGQDYYEASSAAREQSSHASEKLRSDVLGPCSSR